MQNVTTVTKQPWKSFGTEVGAVGRSCTNCVSQRHPRPQTPPYFIESRLITFVPCQSAEISLNAKGGNESEE